MTRVRLGFLSLMEDAPWGGSEHLWAATAEAGLAAGHDVVVSVAAWDEVPAPLARLAALGAQVLRRGPEVSSVSVRSAPDRRAGLRGLGVQRVDSLRRRLRRGRQVRAFLGRRDLDVVCVSQGAVPIVGQVEISDALLALDCPYVVLTNGSDDRDDLSEPLRARLREVFLGAHATGFPAASTQSCAERQLAAALPNSWRFAYPNRLVDVGRLPWPTVGDEARLAFVGRVSVAKGVDVLIQAMGAPAWADRPFHLDLYGDVHGGGYFEDLVARYDLGSRVTFHGHVEDVAGIWATHHLHVLTSRVEGAPIAAAEAMLAGRPSVVTAVGALPEWVCDGVTGFLAPSPEATQVGAALDRAWQARPRWPEIGAAAHGAVADWGFAEAADDLLARLEAAAAVPR